MSHPASRPVIGMPSLGTLVALALLIGLGYYLWPMLDLHLPDRGQKTSSPAIGAQVGYDHSAIDALPKTLTVTLIRSVYDGDTFRVESTELVSRDDKGIPIRIRGVDAAEIRGQCQKEKLLADASRQWLIQRLNIAEHIVLTHVDYREDPFGRVIADVMLDGSALRAEILEVGGARPWVRGKAVRWCDAPA